MNPVRARSMRVKPARFISGPEDKGSPDEAQILALQLPAWVSAATQSITSLSAVNLLRPAAMAFLKVAIWRSALVPGLR